MLLNTYLFTIHIYFVGSWCKALISVTLNKLILLSLSWIQMFVFYTKSTVKATQHFKGKETLLYSKMSSLVNVQKVL